MANLLDVLKIAFEVETVHYECDVEYHWGWNNNSIVRVVTTFNTCASREMTFKRKIISARYIKGVYEGGRTDTSFEAIMVFFEGDLARVFFLKWHDCNFEQVGVVDLLGIDITPNPEKHYVFFLNKGEFIYDLSEDSRFPKESRRTRLEYLDNEWLVTINQEYGN